MKAIFIVLGLFFAVCFAQDTFFEKESYTLINGVSQNFATDCTAYLDGHIYSLSSINCNANHLNPDYGTNPSKNHLVVLFDVTGKKSVFLGFTSSANYFEADNLCTDGTYLYASLHRNGGSIPLEDEFETTNNVCSAVYKIDKNLKIVDRVAAVDEKNFVSFSSCTVLPNGKPVFMVTASNTKNITLKHKTHEAVNYSSDSNYVAYFFSDIFVDEPSLLHTIENPTQLTGSVLASGKGDTFLASVNKRDKLDVEYIRLSGDTHLIGSDELTLNSLAGDNQDNVNIVRLGATSFASVFEFAGKIQRGSKVLCEGSYPYLVIIKHQASNEGVTSSDPVCIPIGKSSDDTVFANYKTSVIHHAIDGKIFLAAPFRVFRFDFCGTVLYTNHTTSNSKAAMVLVSIDADTAQCLSAQVIDPVADQSVKGMISTSENSIALLEAFTSPSGLKDVIQSVVMDYVRCEDGTLDFNTKECVCFDGGKSCKNRIIYTSSDSSSSHGHASDSSVHPHPTSSSTITPTSQSVDSDSSSKKGFSLYTIILLACTGAFLITSILFIVLFIVA